MKNHQISALAMVSAASIGLFGGSAALADEVPSNSLRFGSYTVFYHASADNISGPYVPPGVNLEAENVETIYLGYIRRLSSKFDVELALGYPPPANVKGSGPAMVGSVPYNGVLLSSARWIAPTLFVEYRFMSENSPWQPFVGVGVNYTTFYDRNTTAAGNAAFGGPTRLSLSASVGPAATVGIGYHVSGPWNVYGSYSIAQVKSDLSANTAGIERTTNISYGPQVLIVSVGYSF